MNKIIFPSLEKLTFLTRIYFFEQDIFGKNKQEKLWPILKPKIFSAIQFNIKTDL